MCSFDCFQKKYFVHFQILSISQLVSRLMTMTMIMVIVVTVNNLSSSSSPSLTTMIIFTIISVTYDFDHHHHHHFNLWIIVWSLSLSHHLHLWLSLSPPSLMTYGHQYPCHTISTHLIVFSICWVRARSSSTSLSHNHAIKSVEYP